MATLKLVEAKSRFKAVNGQFVKTCEKYWQVFNDNGTKRKGERYHAADERYARLNNLDIDEDDEDDGESGLRQRETYAAYQAAGCTSAFWEDQDAGRV